STDRAGRLLTMNPAAEHLLGWTADELSGKDIHQAIHFQRADRTPLPIDQCLLRQALESGSTIRVDSDVFTRKDGAIFPVAYTSSPIIVDGTMVGAVVAFRDITDRLKAARLLEENQQRYKSLVDYNPDMVVSFDLDGKFVSVNDACSKLSGYSVEELLAMPSFAPLVSPEEVELVTKYFQKA